MVPYLLAEAMFPVEEIEILYLPCHSGEFVIRKKAVESIGVNNLAAMNGDAGASAGTQAKNRGGLIQFFEDGGSVLPITETGKVTKANLSNATIADLEATLKFQN